MAMENKRITQLSTERLTLTSGDYVMVDDADNGSAKYRLDRLKETDTTLSVSGKAADAAATGQAISDEAEARDNADNALGEDISDLKSATASILESTPLLFSALYRQGIGIGSSGGTFDSPKRIATPDFTAIPDSTKRLEYDIVSGYRLFIATYSSMDALSKIRTYGWLTGKGQVNLTSTEKFVRVCIASLNDSIQCTPEDADKAAIDFPYQLFDDLNDGLVYKGNIPAETDLNSIASNGIYNISNNIQLSNTPSGFTGGTLLVFYGYSRLSDTVKPYCQIIQMLISPVNNGIWMRYRSGSENWNDWVVIKNQTIVEKTKWLAVGDSITYGVYSYISSSDTPASAVTVNSNWVTLLSKSLDYDVTKMASRGMGYTVTGQDPDDSSLPRINLDALLTRIEALTDDFNLITLAFGINDYATSGSTIEAIKTSLNSAIERLMIKFPNARLVVITPFNSAREGNASTNFAYNSALGGRTLKDVSDAIKERCEAYGVECINATNGFLFNTFNIEGLQPDKTHPSLIGHKLIAKNIAHMLLC